MAEFGDFENIVYHQETVDALNVLQAQLGLDEAGVLVFTQGLGIAVTRMLVDATSKTEDPRVDIIISDGATPNAEVIEVISRSLSWLREKVENRDS